MQPGASGGVVMETAKLVDWRMHTVTCLFEEKIERKAKEPRVNVLS